MFTGMPPATHLLKPHVIPKLLLTIVYSVFISLLMPVAIAQDIVSSFRLLVVALGVETAFNTDFRQPFN